MAFHKMKLSKEPFEKIISGQKIIESRLYDKKRKLLNVGDSIKFSQSDDPAKTATYRVRALYVYASFDELFSDFPPELFGSKSKKIILEEINNFYSQEDQKHYGVLGIRIDE